MRFLDCLVLLSLYRYLNSAGAYGLDISCINFAQALAKPPLIACCFIPYKAMTMSAVGNSSSSSGRIISALIGSNGRLQSARYYEYQHRQQRYARLLLPGQDSPSQYGSASSTGYSGGHPDDSTHTSQAVRGSLPKKNNNSEAADYSAGMNKPCAFHFMLVICALAFIQVIYMIGMSIGGRQPSFLQPISPDERERYRNSGVYWDFTRKLECLDSYHSRKYTAQLQNVPHDRNFSPTRACQSLPIEISGHTFETPDQCRQVGVHMHGYWTVYDPSDCTIEDEIQRYRKSGMFWGTAVPAEYCHSFDKREYEAPILNIPRGYNWNKACQYMPAVIQDQQFERPDSCELRNSNVYGKWVVSNQLDCKPYWGPLRDVGCQASGKKRYEAELWNLVAGDDWYKMCSSTPATWHGIYYEHPTTCDNRGPRRGGMIGVWDIENC